MPTVRFSFQGYLTSDISTAYDLEAGKDVDVSKYTDKELVEALKSGKLALSLSHAYDNSAEPSESELFDYSVA